MFYISTCAQNRECFAWERPECSLFLPFPQLILVLWLYFSIPFNDNFSLTVEIFRMLCWWVCDCIRKYWWRDWVAYMAELLVPISYLPPGNWSVVLSYPCLSYWRSHNEDQPLEKLSSVASKLPLIQFGIGSTAWRRYRVKYLGLHLDA